MAVIKTLSISIVARTKKFRKSLRQAGRRVKAFASKIKRMALIAGTIAVAGLALLVRQAFKTVDALAKMADSLGITTENLAGLRRAAVLTGVSIEVLEKSIGKMAVKVGEALDGLAESKRAFASLGLDPAKLRLLSVTEQFFAVADAINKLTNDTDKISLAYEIFGRQGIKLINTLRLGSKGLKESIERIKQLGGAINRVDAAKIEAANDAISDLKIVLSGLGQKLAAKLAPIVEAIALGLINWGIQGKGSAEIIINGMESMALGALTVVDTFALVHERILQLTLVGAKMDRVFTNSLSTVLKALGKIQTNLGNPIGILITATGEALKRSVESTVEDAEDVLMKFMSRVPPSEKIREFFAKLQDDAQKAAQAIADSRKRIKQFGGDFDPRETTLKTKRTADFKQINLSRFGFGGTSSGANKKQKVADDVVAKLMQQLVQGFGVLNNTLIGRTFAAVLP